MHITRADNFLKFVYISISHHEILRYKQILKYYLPFKTRIMPKANLCLERTMCQWHEKFDNCNTYSSWVPNFCSWSDDALYLYQNLLKYLKGFQSYWANKVCKPIFKKGNNYLTVGGVRLPFSRHHLVMLYICTKFQENISNGFRVIEQTRFTDWNLQRAIISETVTTYGWKE